MIPLSKYMIGKYHKEKAVIYSEGIYLQTIDTSVIGNRLDLKSEASE